MKFLKRERRTALLWLLERFGVPTEVFFPHGVEVRVPKGADLSMRYNLTRRKPYEVGEARLIQTHLRPGTHVIELGGCVGVISALIRHTIGPDATHVVVEADPDLAPVCGANAARAAAPGASILVQAAVAYQDQPTIRFASGHNAHVGHIAGAGETGRDVPVIRLADLVQRLPEQGDAALICDIEGGELAMIRQDRASLARFSLIVLETHPDVYADGQADLSALENDLITAGFNRIDTHEQVWCLKRVPNT